MVGWAPYAQVYRKRELEFVMSDDDNQVDLLERGVRPGERSVIAFLEAMISRGTLVEGDLLVTDNDSAWRTDFVTTLLGAHSIEHMSPGSIPVITASTPCFAAGLTLNACWKAMWTCAGGYSCSVRFTTRRPRTR